MKSFQTTKDIWDANLYDHKHSFVSKYGNSLVELLNPQQGEKILDLGCGTGDLANALYEHGAKIVGVDKSQNMVEQAISKFPHIEFMVQDATNLDYDHEFDAVFSNATLHWVQPADKALSGIYKSLKQGGRFVAEFGGKGNVQTIINEIIQQIQETGFEFNRSQFPWYYPSIAEYSTLMEEAGFRVTYAQHYDRPTPLDGENGLKNWIHMFGKNLFEGLNEHTTNEIISTVEHNLKEILYNDGTWIADYKRIRVIGIK
ncbi:methyltransferase domain-containing protein [Bacillus sp. BRMEA1]|uniref:class I SAM-dependent methyltransferase n=1 Tax=Neobacillus endophyticus TaxID=2738405 RepID=UPI0015643470|nr:class I SAM-dependent methyltransferase [Neobacillus endophyticus]NRD77050.1 methyltransferase domain-containing protein [Neobacillus endophyticus]